MLYACKSGQQARAGPSMQSQMVLTATMQDDIRAGCSCRASGANQLMLAVIPVKIIGCAQGWNQNKQTHLLWGVGQLQ